MAAEEKRKAQREQAFIPPVEEKPKKETKKKGRMIFCDIHALLELGYFESLVILNSKTFPLDLPFSHHLLSAISNSCYFIFAESSK